MDLKFTAAEEAYRLRCREWIAANAHHAAAVAKAADPVQAARDWQRRLCEAGYVGLAWPKAYGGQDATLTQQVIVSEEMARAKLPPLINTIGLSILGPTLARHGTEAQRRRFLPRILSGEELWCQGFSEPGAGSDLASLATRAVLEGDDFVVTGQKLWTSLGPIADWCFLLVRTDPSAPQREGISYLLCRMDTPGISVRPLRNAGGGVHFSEVFFDAVRIPREQLVGELHGGWKIARSTLDHERSGLSGVISLEGSLERLWRQAAAGGEIADAVARQQAAQYWIELEGLRYLGLRALSDQLAGRQPGASASVGKLFAAKLRQKVARAALDNAGPYACLTKKSPHVVGKGRLVAGYFDSLGYSIGGGTSEIMHNVIAERVLGLPRSTGEA
ncbi:acyl-CoA dehydrogenase family protein [Aromatoleum toluclasticum]|uniref:acyl-CoA dehydrogenase family protein n=1 Tax=Aromatoleum toluclasticum TaxID=92003 RepID=UPI001D1842A8|nr:acyl-CoA dehydrogenase family protein [Aromatoleum toluclasticum]MCC4114856.1 acyl-CoA dehydrogenase family protein [Aromatoleum toluclasticum]